MITLALGEFVPTALIDDTDLDTVVGRVPLLLKLVTFRA